MSKINIITEKKHFPIAPELYGLFFEDINRSGDSGLYPEMLRNRAFDDSIIPDDFTIEGNDIVSESGYHWFFNSGEGVKSWPLQNNNAYTPIPAWYCKDAAMELDDADTLNANRAVSLTVHFDKGGFIYNTGYAGVPAKAGEAYAFYMFAKSDKPIDLMLSFETENRTLCSRCITVCGTGFIRYDTVFVPNETTRNASFVITCTEGGSVKFGFMSLMPADTFNGHGLRRDLIERLRDMNPAFLRFPGGCIVEGASKSTAMRFTTTVGPVWERPGHQNVWQYRMTDGLGFHEYLQLCEDLDIEPLYVCNCGMTCQARKVIFFEGKEIDEMLDEVLAAIEYATCSVDTKWGALRARMGHPSPFKLNYIEIGNENSGPEYNERYNKFRTAIIERYPWLKIISNTHIEKDGLPTDIVDEHFYNNADWFSKNTHLFDNYDRKGPDIFIGELAVVRGKVTKLYTALAEAMFMIGMERNQDIVKLASYAPLLENVHYRLWYPNMIVFDNMRNYAIPSYYSWKMFAKARGSHVVWSTQESGIKFSEYKGAPSLLGDIGLKFRNPKWNSKNVTATHEIAGHVEANGEEYITTAPDERQINERVRKLGLGDKALIIMGNDEKADDGEFEIEIFAEEGKEIGIGIYSGRKPTQIWPNDSIPTEEETWTRQAVSPLNWIIKEGVSSFTERSSRNANQLTEPVKVNIKYGEYNTFKYVSKNGNICFYINGEQIMNAIKPNFPSMQSVALDSNDEVIIKLVNIAEQPDNIEITLDCDVEADYTANIMAGDPDDCNSLDDPEHVHDVAFEMMGAGRCFIYKAPAYSVNVIKLRKRHAD